MRRFRRRSSLVDASVPVPRYNRRWVKRRKIPPNMEHNRSIGFSSSEQHMPAVLLRLLLIRAGVEPNPGPARPNRYPCSTCGGNAYYSSVLCSSCKNWVHSKKTCSGLERVNQYCKDRFKCPKCLSTTTQNQKPLNILQFNINGMVDKTPELMQFMKENDIAIGALQETKLNFRSKLPKTYGYRLVRKDRDAANIGGGICFLIREDILAKTADLPAHCHDGTMEAAAISIATTNGDITLVNVYIPPVGSCPTGYAPPVASIFDIDRVVVLGDFNAHNKLWHSPLNDSRGEVVANLIDQSDLVPLNENQATRLPTTAGQRHTSPDLSLASSELAPLITWNTKTALNSDHKPIIIQIESRHELIVSEKRTFVNFSKADWPRFTAEVEEKLSSLRPNNIDSVHKREVQFRRIVVAAAKRNIPHGRRKLYDPSLSIRANELIRERDDLRAVDPSSDRIAELNKAIVQECNNEKTRKWHDFVDRLDQRTANTKRLWSTIKALDGKGRGIQNTPIRFSNGEETESSLIANKLLKQFTAVRHHKSSAESRLIIRKIHKKRLSKVEFSVDDVKQAIKASKNSRAFGPDEIAMPYLKHLGPVALRFLTDLFNLSASTSTLPLIWKRSIIIALPKPGKDPNLAASYRPISLLCPAAKIMERLILPLIVAHLPPATHQHGFRPGHSTTSALLHLSTAICQGFNQPRPAKRTIAVALDLSKAYDSVDHTQLLQILADSTLPGWTCRWLTAYLRGREAKCNFRNTNSKITITRMGVPQGSVISPALFNAYIRDLPVDSPKISVVSYADDITVFTSDADIPTMENQLNDYLGRLASFLERRQLIISTEKSTSTLFTPDTKQHSLQLNIQINAKRLPTEKHPKILGVTFDPSLSFNRHVELTKQKVQKRNNILKVLSGRTWGARKETILMTYKAVGRSIMNYAAPVWTPTTKRSNFDKLQCCQNAALRTATGCIQMTPIDHLHSETKMLSVVDHNRLLADQYFVACLHDGHPCRQLFGCPGPPVRRQRNFRLKLTLTMYSSSRTQRHLSTLPPTANLHQQHNKLHQIAVIASRHRFIQPNPLLNRRPPNIARQECKLPRSTRSKLAQLRCGYSYLLASTRSRLDNTGQTLDICPHCLAATEDTPHLFNCTSRPIRANIVELWRQPISTAAALNL